MITGPMFGALAPGSSAPGMFGGGAQGVGQGMPSTGSPLLAMLMHRQGGGGAMPFSASPNPTPTMNSGAIQAPSPAPNSGMDPNRRRQLGLALMQFGQSMGGSPFGPRPY